MPGVGVRRAGLFVCIAAILIAAWVFRAPLGRSLLAALGDVTTGGRVSFEAVALGRSEATLDGVRFAYAGVPVFAARRVRVHYRLRDLFPGGSRRDGLEAVDLTQPDVVLERRADGSFMLPGGGASTAGGAVSAPGAGGNGAPLRFTVTVRGGSFTLLDPARNVPGAQRLFANHIDASATIDAAGRTQYVLTAAQSDDTAQTLRLAGTVDNARGYAVHRLRAHALSLVPIVNYFINTRSAAFTRAELSDVDLRAYAFGGPQGLGPYHFAGSAGLVQGAMNVPGLLSQARDMHGRIDLFDDGLASPRMTARLGAARVRLVGGLYHWSAPEFRLGLASESELGALRPLFRFSRDLPLHGALGLTTFLEGPVGTPLVATSVRAPHVRYGEYPVDDATGRAIFYDQSVDIAGLRGRYGGFEVLVNGALALGPLLRTQLVLAARGGTSSVPYLAQAAPAVVLDAQALLTGNGQRFEIHGAAGGSGGRTRVAALFGVDAAGEGAFGPLSLVRDDGASLEGTFYLHRSASESGFWLAGHDYPLVAIARTPRLPGLALAAPQFAGRLSGALAGDGPPARFRIAGRVAARDLRIGTLTLERAAGDVAGSLGSVRLANVTANGAWGRFAGRGAYADQRLALEGRYAGDFSRLAVLTGDLGARGPVEGPVALIIDNGRTLVQVRAAETTGSHVHGLALESLSGTLAVAGRAVSVYGATAALAGGTAAASGDLGGPQTLAFSLGEVDAAGALRAAGFVPGRVSAVGTVSLKGRSAEFDGGLAVRGARFRGVPITGNGDVAFDTAAFRVTRADALAGPAFGTFAGAISAPGTSGAQYAMQLHVPATELEPLARLAAPQVPYLVGTLAADVRVSGRLGAGASRPAVAGMLSLPEGSVNGLGFEDGVAQVRSGAEGLDAREGSVVVGSSRVRFAASVRGPEASLRVDAPRADLADFNDFFDAGDTLGGVGRVEGRFLRRRAAFATDADIAIAGLRYRRFDLGNATARLTSHGSRVRGTLSFGGPSGTLVTWGTLDVAAGSLEDVATQSRFEGTARLAALDLGVWLPALGYQLPIGGRVDAQAAISGRLGDPDVKTTATLTGGSIGPFSVDRLVLRAASNLRRTTVEQADLKLPALDASLSGSFGFGERDPLSLAVHAKTSNIGLLASRLSFGTLGATGTAEADVKVGGTPALPQVTGGFDIERATLRGVAIPQALGQFSLHGRDVVLSGAEVNFATGSLALAGSVPLQILPFGLGPAGAPISLEASANGIDLRSFTPLLPTGSTLAGRLDGRVGIGGTAGAPRLTGGVSLAAGTLRTPAETIPLENIEAQVALAGNTVALQRLHAQAGGGTLGATGTANVPDFIHPREDATYAFSAQARGLTLNFPAYGGGQLSGALQFAHATGALPVVRGNITLSEATIPFSTLLGASGSSGGATVSPGVPDFALDLALIAERNVRVRSANVDIGARGSVHAGGTYAAPVLAGGFTSTGGTLSYFNTVFRLLDGTVTFAPDLGVIPTLQAHAITHVIDPDPNTVRNAAGSADITLGVTGPVNALSIALSSNPAYDRQQILGLLLNAPAFGASNLFGETAQNPQYYGSTSTAQQPQSLVTSRNAAGQLSVAQEAFGVANAEFTRTLLAPFETTFAGALGLSNFNLNVDYTGSVGLSARKVLGKDVNAIYDTSFGYPYRQTFGFEVKPNPFEAAQVTVFQTLGAYGVNSLTPTGYVTAINSKIRAAQPVSGSEGFSISIQRLFP